MQRGCHVGEGISQDCFLLVASPNEAAPVGPPGFWNYATGITGTLGIGDFGIGDFGDFEGFVPSGRAVLPPGLPFHVITGWCG